MLYNQTEYLRMKWQLQSLSPKTNILKEFPELAEIYNEALAFGIPNNCGEYLSESQVMKFIVYTYHYYSPFAQKVADPADRKKKVLREIGVDLVKAEKDETAKVYFVTLITGRNPFVSYLSLHFLKYENNYKWLEACRLNELISDTYIMLQDNNSEKQNSAQFAASRATAYEKSKNYRKDYDTLCRQLMADDLALQDYMASHILREKRKAIITPERYVLAMEETNGNPFQLIT